MNAIMRWLAEVFNECGRPGESVARRIRAQFAEPPRHWRVRLYHNDYCIGELNVQTNEAAMAYHWAKATLPLGVVALHDRVTITPVRLTPTLAAASKDKK